MKWNNNIKQGELKEVFDSLEEAFLATGTDYYLIGALARDVWYARGNKTFRQTKDVDFAILVGSVHEFEAIKDYLKEKKNFQDSKGNSFVMMTPSGMQVDILPFGSIEIDDGVHLGGKGLTSIKVNGFREVYDKGTEDVQMETGHHFKIATLSSIVLLKLIAYDDRPEQRSKDARDIANIITHYFDLQADRIYADHADLFCDDNENWSLQDISAAVIGREIGQTAAHNGELLQRLRGILQKHTVGKEDSAFIRQIVTETERSVEVCVVWLQRMLEMLA